MELHWIGSIRGFGWVIHSFIHSSFITSTGSHIQIYSEVQLYNKLYLYTIGLHTHIMQDHKDHTVKYYKNIKTIPHKKRNLKKITKK